MDALLRVPRSRGALSGLVLIALGAWGAVIPLVGPYFHYAYTPDSPWAFSLGRLWLEILPGAGTLLGGLIVAASSYRHMGQLGAWLAILSGGWFALGMVLRPVWNGAAAGGPSAGMPAGGVMARMWEQVGFFTGLGVAIVLVATTALGRFSLINSRQVRDGLTPEPGPPGRRMVRPQAGRFPVGPVTGPGTRTGLRPAPGARPGSRPGAARDGEADERVHSGIRRP